MDRGFVQELAQSLIAPVSVPHAYGTRVLAPPNWADRTPERPKIHSLSVDTLSGLVDYVEANRDGLPLAECVVHVNRPDQVNLWGKVGDMGTGFAREMYADASFRFESFPFGSYQDAEMFTVLLQTRFMETPERENILKLVASIKEHSVRETVDSGVAQEVKTAGGVALVGMVKVPNPVILRPFRTFREVDQPPSLFVLRLQSGKEGEKPRLALFEADGGLWRLEATKNIAEYLRNRIGGTVSVLA